MQKLSYKKILITILSELTPIVVVVFGTFIVLAHIAHSNWLNSYLYNGDSLTLAILRQSIAHKDPMQWVFSAQLNLFPEGVFYAISSFFMSSIRATFVLSSILNVVVYYVLIRYIIKALSIVSVFQQRIYSLLSTLLLIGYMLLETQNNNNGQTMATFFLFTTYYYGLIIGGLFIICLILRQLKEPTPLKGARNITLSALTVVTSALIIVSNPLYVPQFLVPFMLTLLILLSLKLIRPRKFILLESLQLLSLVVDMLLRSFMRAFIGQSLGSHLSRITDLKNWYYSFFNALGAIAPSSNLTVTLRLRVILGIVIYYACLLYTLVLMNKKIKDRRIKIDPLILFIMVFVSIEPVILIILLSGVSGLQQRYLITPLVLPLLGLTVLLINIKSTHKIKQYIPYFTVTLAVFALLIGGLSIPRLGPLVSSAAPGEACLSAALDDKPANGISDYWTARPLDVYNLYNERVLQVTNFNPFAWLNNLGTYQNKQFTFIVESRNTLTGSYQILGKPSKSNNCPDFKIYQYYPGTKGYKLLNARIQSSLKVEIRYRKAGLISSYQSEIPANNNKRIL